MLKLAALSLVPLALTTSSRAQWCELDFPARTPNGSPSSTTYADSVRLSANGRWVAWSDHATDLVPGHTGLQYNVFLRDRELGVTAQVDLGPNGEEANGHTLDFDMTPDARWLVLASSASNLVPGDANGRSDAVLFDRLTNAREIVSVNDQGVQTNGGAHSPSISPDGRFVAFMSEATNLDPLDTDFFPDIFVRDRLLGTTRLASIDQNGIKGAGGTYHPRISADGRYVVFHSDRSTWFPETGLPDFDVFRKDMLTGQIQLVSVTLAGTPGNGDSEWHPWISPDGRWVAFNSEAGNLVNMNTFASYHVYLRDMQAGVTTLVSSTASGQPAPGTSFLVGVAPDLSYAAFSSTALGLAPGDNNVNRHVYRKNLATGAVTRVDQTPTGVTGNGECYTIGAVSQDGSCVAFMSSASNLVPGVPSQANPVFVRDCPVVAGTPLCFGDGSGQACPCDNSGAPGHGCANPVRAEGARLTAFGEPSLANDTLVLAGDSTTNSSVTYFQGTGTSGTGIVFGDGLLCVNGSLIRLGRRNAVAGASRYPGPNDASISVRGQIPAGGAVRYYQIWYRIAASFCTPATYSFSNGYRIVWSL